VAGKISCTSPPGPAAAVSAKAAPDLSLRSEITAPEATHRELPHLGTVAGIADPGRAPSEIVGQALRLPERRFDSPGDSPPLHQHERDTKPAQQQFEIIGVLSKLYVLMENASGLVLVDQHAAHERVLFEELRRRMEQQGVPTQKLLLPQTFDVPPRDADWIEHNLSVCKGWESELRVSVRARSRSTVSSFLDVSDAAQFMRKVIDDLKSASNSASAMRWGKR
jgi:DNA mismatch repair enzyme (predicted ATPase)